MLIGGRTFRYNHFLQMVIDPNILPSRLKESDTAICILPYPDLAILPKFPSRVLNKYTPRRFKG